MARLLLAAAALLLALPARADCDSDSQCKGGRVCQRGQCVYPQPEERAAPNSCRRNRDCNVDELCNDGVCLRADSPEGRTAKKRQGLAGFSLWIGPMLSQWGQKGTSDGYAKNAFLGFDVGVFSLKDVGAIVLLYQASVTFFTDFDQHLAVLQTPAVGLRLDHLAPDLPLRLTAAVGPTISIRGRPGHTWDGNDLGFGLLVNADLVSQAGGVGLRLQGGYHGLSNDISALTLGLALLGSL